MRRCVAGLLALGVVAAFSGCGGGSAEGASGQSAGSDASDATAGDAAIDVAADVTTNADAAASCELGTMYPDAPAIDPDAPVYEDASWTQAEVTAAFAEAKAQNTYAYQAYRAASELGSLLECPFCACGCAPSIGHRSAIDCFKDMHGFA